jgi:crotonobetainyl-CoA:carnitine CoA-transferase CaiB-like acyl-CoA transferase
MRDSAPMRLDRRNATLIEQAVININRVPTGNLGQTAAPADIYRTKDGWVLCQVTGHPLFIRWARRMGEEDQWLNDPHGQVSAL